MGKHKKRKTVKPQAELSNNNNTPRSFVFHRGVVGKNIHQLITDIRHLMEPYTAVNLKVTKSNVLKDFVHVAGPYGISHFITFSKTDLAPYMKICRLPRGPTLTFKVQEYSLMRDITAILKRPKTIGPQFKYPPLVVLNHFDNNADEAKLMTTTFQNMFPPIKIHKVKLSEIKRCALFNYDKENDTIDFRHYNIEATPVGINKGIKRLLKPTIPNLGKLNDISDLIEGGAYLSESEGEEPNDSHVTLPQRMAGRGNMKSSQSAIKLTEMGPRLKLELIKIEEGVSSGEVLYHKYVEKSETEKKDLKKKKVDAKQLKEKRRAEQEANVAKKQKAKEEHKEKCLAGMKRKLEETNAEKKESETNEDADDDDDDSAENDEDDESEKENGEEEESDDGEDDDEDEETDETEKHSKRKQMKMNPKNNNNNENKNIKKKKKGPKGFSPKAKKMTIKPKKRPIST